LHLGAPGLSGWATVVLDRSRVASYDENGLHMYRPKLVWRSPNVGN
jgi:hypothetical protein